jgi:hypothetical protein
MRDPATYSTKYGIGGVAAILFSPWALEVFDVLGCGAGRLPGLAYLGFTRVTPGWSPNLTQSNNAMVVNHRETMVLNG